ncbi:hypothetical protein YC2023_121917 [Brassica napus]
MRFFECLLLLLLLLCSTSISTHFRSRKKMPTNLELRRSQHHFGKAQKPSRAVKGRTTPPTDQFGKAQKPSRAVKGRRDYSAPISAVLTLKRASEIYGANYAAHSTISERPRNHQGRLKGELRRPQTSSERPRNHQGRLKDVAIIRHQFQPNDAAHSTISERPRNHQGRLKNERRRPQHHFGKAQKPSRAVKGRHDFSAPNSAVLTLKRAAEIYGANYAAHRPFRKGPETIKGGTTPPTDQFGKAQKPSRAVKGRRDYSAPISAVLTLKRASEIYGANYAAHSTISERPRNHQGRLKGELRRPQTSSERPRNHQGRLKDVAIIRHQFQPNDAAHSTISERPRNHQGTTPPTDHFGKAQKPSRAVKGHRDFSAPISAVLTLKRASEIYGANDAAHSTISERPRNHQGRLKDELRRPQTISERPRNHQGRLKDVAIFRHQFQPNDAAHSTISERPRNHQGRLKNERRRPQHHFGKAQKPSRAVKGRHDFSAPNSAVLTLKRAAEIYGANYAAHRPFRKGPETIKGGTTPPTDQFGKAQKPSRAVKGRRDYSAPISAVLTLKRASEIYGANYAAHSTISERPRNHQGRLKGELRRPQTSSERPRNHQGRLKDVAIIRHQFQPNDAAHSTISERPRNHQGTTPPTDHFGKAQKPSRAVKGHRDFSAPISAVLTLKRASEIYGANDAAHSTISERPRNHQGRLKDELRRPQTISERPRNHQGRLKDVAIFRHQFQPNDAAHSTISERPRNHQGRLKGELRRPQTSSERPRNHQGRLKDVAIIRHQFQPNDAAHSTISERPRNHQGRLKDELRRPQTISERPRNHQGRLKDIAIFRHQFQPNDAAHSTISERPRNHQGRLKGERRRPQHHFGKAQKPSRAVKGRHDFSAPNSAVLTLKRAAEIYGA